MKSAIDRKWIYAIAGLSALVLVPVGSALARTEQCITEETKCDHDLLCTFKVELAEKLLLYRTFVANSPATKKAPKRTLHGVKYSGALYNAALAEARAEDPGSSEAELAAPAYHKFMAKVRQKLDAEGSKYKNCKALGVQNEDDLRGTWSGMHTDKNDCNVYGDIGRGDEQRSVSLDDLKAESEGCLEVYESDRGHEAVHQEFCRKRLTKQIPPSNNLASYIDEDIAAYRYSVQHAYNDLEKMQILCSTDPKTDAFRKRADQLMKQVKKYKLNQASQP
jgi:hypothetical protein